MKNIIPEHKTGKKVDCFETVEFKDTTEAVAFYDVARERLLNINGWGDIATIPSSQFCLVDQENDTLERPAKVGDYVRIDIPGPGLPSSKGFDWVRVESIDEEVLPDYRRTALSLRPAQDPTNPHSDIAHFFKALATSTLLVEQKHNSVSVQYAGRNELVNTENTTMTDNIRNFLVGIATKMGASFPQWRALVKGIISKKPRDK